MREHEEMTDELKQWEYEKGYERGKADALKVIEDIKAEIQSKADELQTKPEISYDSAFADGLECAVTIIDKHIGGDEE